MMLTIFAPKPDKIHQLRMDADSEAKSECEISIFRFKMIGKQVDYFKLPPGVSFIDFDLVIMEQTLRNIQYLLFLLNSFRKTKIASWGHEKVVVPRKRRA